MQDKLMMIFYGDLRTKLTPLINNPKNHGDIIVDIINSLSSSNVDITNFNKIVSYVFSNHAKGLSLDEKNNYLKETQMTTYVVMVQF